MRKAQVELLVSTFLVVAAGGVAHGDVITRYSDRAEYEAAAGVAQTVEDFTDSTHFPIASGVLNSQTTDAGLQPGDIEEGVTYSTPVGTGNFFNIDAGGGYPFGPFLDGFNPSDRDVTMRFHESDPGDARAVRAFGFDMGILCNGATTTVTVSFSSGPDQEFTIEYPSQIEFFGFVSDRTDITQVVVSNEGCFFGFDFDNFTFDTVGTGGGCAADLDGDGDADADDFFEYLDAFADGNFGVCDIDLDGDCDADDFFEYLDLFAQGC